MDNAERISKKRKRKHGSKKDNPIKETETPVEGTVAVSTEQAAKPKKKKSRKEKVSTPTAELEVDAITEDKDEEDEEEDEDEGRKDEDKADSDSKRPSHPDADINASEDDTSLPKDTQLHLPVTGENPKTFADLNLSPRTMKAIESMGYTTLTEVQARTIQPCMTGRDVLGAAKTGSGKTLAFLIPAVEMLASLHFKPRNGTGVVVSPTSSIYFALLH
jgi:ATP-dependent RNA helicase DDX18/HAS1